jgi:hypothetical protein
LKQIAQQPSLNAPFSLVHSPWGGASVARFAIESSAATPYQSPRKG